VRAGVAAAIVAGVAGYALERARFGASDAAALARVEAELRNRFDASAAMLASIARRVAADSAVDTTAMRDQTAVRRLFDLAAATLPAEDTPRTGVTIYDPAGSPLAWAGRVSDLPSERVQASAALLIAPGALGPRLIRVEPVNRAGARVSTVVVEQSLVTSQESPGIGDTFRLTTSILPVTLVVRPAGASPPAGPYRFVVPARDSAFMLEGQVAPEDLARARDRWRATTWAVVLSILAATLLLCIGPVIDMRRRTSDTSRFVLLAALLIVIVVGARVILYVALEPIAPSPGPTPFDLLFTTATMAAVVWLVLDLVERRRTARPRPALLLPGTASIAGAMAAYAAAGFASTALLWG